ncbi:hypothetical protein ANO11243_015290 [Dothideomycetidae sp. 11243]|nr:hypothetical protein ANO11243_015290 [fungal sp. No.11243]
MSPLTFFERQKLLLTPADAVNEGRSVLKATSKPWSPTSKHSSVEDKENHNPESGFEPKDGAFDKSEVRISSSGPSLNRVSEESNEKLSSSGRGRSYIPPHLRNQPDASSPSPEKLRDTSPAKRVSSFNLATDEPKRVKFAKEPMIIISPPVNSSEVPDVVHLSWDESTVKGEHGLEAKSVESSPPSSPLQHEPMELESEAIPQLVICSDTTFDPQQGHVHDLLNKLETGLAVTASFEALMERDKALTALVGILATDLKEVRNRLKKLESAGIVSGELPPVSGSISGYDDSPTSQTTSSAFLEDSISGARNFQRKSATEEPIVVSAGPGLQTVVHTTKHTKITEIIQAAFDQVDMPAKSCSLLHEDDMLSIKWTVATAELVDGDELHLEF